MTEKKPERMFAITESELDQIKNDCAYPERETCEGCPLSDGEDETRASGLGCNFKGANALMDEVLTRPLSDMGAQGQQRPTNVLAIPCPKCGKWTFRANIDEGYQILCSDDACGWKQKIEAQPQDAAGKAVFNPANCGRCKIYEACAECHGDDMPPCGQNPTITPASPGKAGDVLAELDEWIEINTEKYGKDKEIRVIDPDRLLKKIAALRQVQQQ